MKVVILCGGMGTRLREETEFRPKSMVKIGTKPILWHIMKHYANYGFNEFVLCLGYKGEMIKEYFYHYMLHSNDVTVKLGQKGRTTIHENYQVEDWEITMVDTGENALKGARIHKIQKYVGDDFMVTYGDGISDINISDLVKFHKKHEKIGTVTGVSLRSSYGQIKSDNGQVQGFIEKPNHHKGDWACMDTYRDSVFLNDLWENGKAFWKV